MLRLIIELTVKLLPLYLYGVLGFIVGKTIKIPKEKVANLMIYFILPIITFHGAYTIPLSVKMLILPLLIFIFSSVLAFVFLYFSGFFWNDNTPHLFSFCSAYGNYGYFAIPAAIILFGTEAESIIIVAGLGFSIFLSTTGYYITARGNFTVKESLKRTASLPVLYAMILGFLLNYLNLHPGCIHGIDYNKIYIDTIRDVRGLFSIFGMMLLGLTLSEMKSLHFDWKFISLTTVSHFILWPLFILIFIYFDKEFFQLFPVIVHKVMFLMSIIPIGINTIAVAIQLEIQPEKAATAILISHLVGMIYIPVLLSLFFYYI